MRCESFQLIMNKNSRSSQLIEEPDRLVVSYSASARAEPALLFSIFCIVLSVCHYFLYQAQVTILSGEWELIPICLFGNAGLLIFLIRSGTIKSAAHISSDGTVRQGIGSWAFPGPMAASPITIGGKSPVYWINLRYGSSTIRLPGDETEGGTIGLAAQINRWVKLRISGMAGSSEASKSPPAINAAVCYVSVMVLTAILGEVASGGHCYLNAQAKIGSWAKVSISIFTALAVIGACIRWSTIARSAIRRGSGVWVVDVAITLLMILGGCSIVGHYAQIFEMRATPATVSFIDEPLRLTKTTTGKGCHRFLILREPSLDKTIQFCDPYAADYWRGVEDVRIDQSSNAFGIHIESIKRIDRP